MKKQKKGIPPGIVGITLFLLISTLAFWLFANFDFFQGKYSFYEGPILPMTSVSGAEGVNVARNVELDFSTYEEDWHPIIDSRSVWVTDTYHLTNSTDKTKTVELAYGFEGQMIDEPHFIPAITADGIPIEAALAAAPDVEKLIHSAGTWKGYRKAVAEHGHLAEALEEIPALDIPVKVYHYYNITWTGTEREPYVFLSLDFTKEKDTHLWVYNSRSSRYDARNGEMMLRFPATPEGTGEGYLLVEGNDITPEYYGYVGYNDSPEAYTDTVTWETETFASTVGEMIELLSKKYDFWYHQPDYPNPGLCTPEHLYSGTMKRFASGTYTDSGMGFYDIEGRFHEVATDISLMYWVFPVTIAPNETVEVTARYRQEASEDLSGRPNPRSGYDIAPTLGSNLNFTTQTATVVNTELVTISGQNLGFDLEAGMHRVNMDLEEERYFLDVVEEA